MSRPNELECLVALLRYGPYQKNQMVLRQRLIEGELPSQLLTEVREQASLYQMAASDVERWTAAGETPLCWLDDEYPQQLREVHDFPPIVFVRGRLLPRDLGISVVGSRDAGNLAIQAAQDIAQRVVEEGFTVVSGLAKGIDTAAHTEALARGGRTVAVIGNGIDKCYPAQNRQLQTAIENQGLVLSQFWPGSAPTKASFPMRNAVMSAYSCASIIVAADENSGTRHQAKQAAAHGRPLVVSRSVYENTTWGRALVDDESVLSRVANNPDEAVELALELSQLMTSDIVLL